MAGLLRRDASTAVVRRMRVVPGHQRRGLGRALLELLEARAAELGYAIVRLDTTTRQERARRLYESSGYVEVCRRVRWDGLTEIHYEKRLDARAS